MYRSLHHASNFHFDVVSVESMVFTYALLAHAVTSTYDLRYLRLSHRNCGLQLRSVVPQFCAALPTSS